MTPQDDAMLRRLIQILKMIARGRCDNGCALSREDARQLARQVLIEFKVDW